MIKRDNFVENVQSVLLYYSINESWLRNVIKANVKFCHGEPFSKIVPEVLKQNVKYLKKNKGK